MKVSWRVTASDAFTEWVNSGKSGVEAVQWLMDYLSENIQVVHEKDEPIMMDTEGETDFFIVTGGLKPEHFGGLFKVDGDKEIKNGFINE